MAYVGSVLYDKGEIYSEKAVFCGRGHAILAINRKMPNVGTCNIECGTFVPLKAGSRLTEYRK